MMSIHSFGTGRKDNSKDNRVYEAYKRTKPVRTAKNVQRVFVLCLAVFSLSSVCAYSQSDADSILMEMKNAYREFLREPERGFSSSDSVLSLVGEWPWGPCQAVDTIGNYVLIGNGKLVQVLDVSNPESLIVVADYLTPFAVEEIRVRDTLAFVSSGGLHILNLANPQVPAQLSFLPLRAPTRIVPTDSFVYTINYFGQLGIIDVTDPSSPRIRTLRPVVGEYAQSLAVKDGFAYIGNIESPIFKVYDVRNPDTIRYVTERLVNDNCNAFGPSAIAIDDTVLYVMNICGTLYLFSVAEPSRPLLLGQVSLPARWSFSVHINNGVLYTVVGNSLYIVDITSPASPRLLDSVKLQNYPAGFVTFSFARKNGHLYTASSHALFVFDVIRPDSLSQISYYPTAGRGPSDVDVRYPYAYVVSHRGGLSVLDISTITQPVRIGVVGMYGVTGTIRADSQYVYVGGDSVWVVDVSSPARPAVAAVIAVPEKVNALAIDNNRLYVLTQSVKTYIFDITQPANPSLLDTSSYGGGYHFTVKDDIAYYAAGLNGFIVVDYTDPFDPQELYRQTQTTNGVLVRDTFAYVAMDGNGYGLKIFNISDPSNPVLLGTLGMSNSITIDLEYSSGYLYYSPEYSLRVIDISNVYSPQLMGGFGSDLGRNIAAYDKFVLLCDRIYGLKILQNNLITSVQELPEKSTWEFHLLQNYPNPFNPSTVISFQLPAVGRDAVSTGRLSESSYYVTLKVYNVLGEEVAELVNGKLSAGVYEVEWNAENYASGVYYYRLVYFSPEVGTRMETKKMLLMK